MWQKNRKSANSRDEDAAAQIGRMCIADRMHQEQQRDRKGHHERKEAPVEREAEARGNCQPLPAIVGAGCAQQRPGHQRHGDDRARNHDLRRDRQRHDQRDQVKQQVTQQIRRKPVDLEQRGERLAARDELVERGDLRGVLRQIDHRQIRADPQRGDAHQQHRDEQALVAQRGRREQLLDKLRPGSRCRFVHVFNISPGFHGDRKSNPARGRQIANLITLADLATACCIRRA